VYYVVKVAENFVDSKAKNFSNSSSYG